MSEEPDHDLEALPPPRRPWRKLTLAVMATTLLGSLALLLSLRGELRFSLSGGAPRASASSRRSRRRATKKTHGPGRG